MQKGASSDRKGKKYSVKNSRISIVKEPMEIYPEVRKGSGGGGATATPKPNTDKKKKPRTNKK